MVPSQSNDTFEIHLPKGFAMVQMGQMKCRMHDIRMHTPSILGLQPCTSDTCVVPTAFDLCCKALLAKGYKACTKGCWCLLIAEMTNRRQYDALALAQHVTDGSCMLRCCYPARRPSAVSQQAMKVDSQTCPGIYESLRHPLVSRFRWRTCP